MAFGGVWKDSLTELSGGQRSLLALSLILAMLLFKPAPIYILDEVHLSPVLGIGCHAGTAAQGCLPHAQPHPSEEAGRSQVQGEAGSVPCRAFPAHVCDH